MSYNLTIEDRYRVSLAEKIRESRVIKGYVLNQLCDFLRNHYRVIWGLIGRNGLAIAPLLDDSNSPVKLCSVALWIDYGPDPALILKQENRIYLSHLAQTWYEKSSFEEIVVCGRDFDAIDIKVLVRFNRVSGALELRDMTREAGR